MKLRALLCIGSLLVLGAAIACDNADAPRTAPPDPGTRSALPEAEARDLRARADAAFAELEGGHTRFESRIGPQPWPDDLPTNWPIPAQARLVASTAQQSGGRLLLVDLPGSSDRARELYRDALERGGYDVSNHETKKLKQALLAKHGRDQAVLTFIGRAEATRVEILLLPPAAG